MEFWIYSVLKVEPIKFADSLDVVYERKKYTNDGHGVFCLSS